MPTIKDVAKLARVSFKTVSRVINDVDNVNPELSARVRAAIDELGYQPNLSARQLRGRPTSIAFIYDNPNSHYIIELQKGILAECRKRGYELVIHPCDSRASDILEELSQLVRRVNIGGLVLTPPLSEMRPVVESLLKNKLRFVRIISGCEPPDALSPCVFVDDRRAALEITQHLIDNGHERIAFLGGDPEHKSTGERLAGYHAALEDSGIRIDPALIVDGSYSFESGVERTRQLLELPQRPTAIFACNDEIAAGTLFAARMYDVDVPGELSIAGFEDSPFSRQTWPNVTTAHQSNEELGRVAASVLIDEIDRLRDKKNDAPSAPEAVGFSPELVIRDSTGPVNEGH
ncbi:MAG: LacI family DNA-binding transcriptional regulator [Gammaproteobacteria bacterium]|nr:LacI family DNA-binding transcriptional regulator [Gammaproteobacteria bacterium]